MRYNPLTINNMCDCRFAISECKYTNFFEVVKKIFSRLAY